jgi:carboxyl-terminal processing protease
LTPEENKQTKDDLGGKFQGIGAQLGLKSNRIVIIAPLKNSPAQRAGVRAGDLIVKVDGQLTRNWTLPAAVSKIRGKKGTKVKLTLERKGKLIDVTIVRDEIIVDSIELSTEKEVDCKSVCPKVAYLKINQFGEKTNDEWDRAIAEVQKKWQAGEIKGLVLDVRDNPGGFLDGAVYLASEFLSRGQLVVKQESSVSQSRDYYSSRQGKLTDIPLVILINKGSASASEILSGALRDYNKATLVGEKSFGKGSVQEAIDLADGAGLHVTVAKWILPRGDWINGRGIEPQIKVENKTSNGNTLTRSNDLQLERAVEVILK